MRRKPVTRSEIRFNGRHITTLPVDAVRKDEFGHIAPIRELWAPLLRALNEWRRHDDARTQAVTAHGSPARPCKPAPVRLPIRFMRPEPRLCTCRQCRGEFYRVYGSGLYCSDRCAEISWRETAMVKARTEPRTAPRPERHCANATCNKPFTARRSTMKFCSMHCRIAAQIKRQVEKKRAQRQAQRGRHAAVAKTQIS